jgi:cell division protein FtsW (lipid II flippase)
MSLASLEWGRAAGGGRKVRGFKGFVVDMPMLLILLAIVGLGMVVLYSAVSKDISLVVRQGMRFAVGLAAFFALAQIPPHYLRIFTPWTYLLGIGLLLAVAVEGQIGKGAQRWLDLGVVTFQPSELLKLAVPMMCAWFMHERRLPPTFPQLVVMGLIVLTPALLIADQPDLQSEVRLRLQGPRRLPRSDVFAGDLRSQTHRRLARSGGLGQSQSQPGRFDGTGFYAQRMPEGD